MHWMKTVWRLPKPSRPVRRVVRTIFATLILFCVLLGSLVWTVSAGMVNLGWERFTDSSLSDVPYADEIDCILVLGAGVREDGTASPMLADRVAVACELYASSSVPLLMSGDHTGDYNEVAVMKELAVAAGVPSDQVFLDHEGYSTYESLWRAKHVFGARRVVIVSQGYHLHRALFIARELEMEAYGAPADLRDYYLQTRYEMREILARFKDFFAAIRPDRTIPPDTVVDLTGNGDLT